MFHLYDYPREFANLMDRLDPDSETGEIIDADGTLAQLDALNLAAEVKLENVGLYLLELKRMTDDLKAEEERLYRNRKAIEKKVERLKAYALPALETYGGKLKTGRVSMRVGSSTAVRIDDEAALPRDFIKVKTVEDVDKKAIGEKLKAGEEIPGASLDKRKNVVVR